MIPTNLHSVALREQCTKCSGKLRAYQVRAGMLERAFVTNKSLRLCRCETLEHQEQSVLRL